MTDYEILSGEEVRRIESDPVLTIEDVLEYREARHE